MGAVDEAGNRYILGLFCGLTHYLIAQPMKNKDAKSVAHALASLLLSQNLVNARIITDNDASFKTVTPLLTKWNLSIGFISPYSPSGNRIERQWRCLKVKAKILGLNRETWSYELAYLLFLLNNSPSTALSGLTPSECLTGRLLPLPVFQTSVNEDIQTYDPLAWMSYISGWVRNLGTELSKKQVEKFLRSEKPIQKGISLEVGQHVYFWRPQRTETSKKLCVHWEGEAVVTEKLQAGSYRIRTSDG